MTAGDLITREWQLERNGLLIGDQTHYDIRQITGLAGSAPVRSQDRSLITRHGSVAGIDYLDTRTIGLTIEIVSDGEDLGSRLAILNEAFGPSNEETEMVFRIPGVAADERAQVLTRVRRRDVPINMEFSRGVARVLMDLVCTDPLIYSNAENTRTTTLSSAVGGGMEFDVTPDLTFGDPGPGGSIVAPNAGNFETYPTFVITGPCDQPIIESTTLDKSLAFDIELGADEELHIDTKTRTIKLGGTASRYSTLDSSSSWFAFQPGINIVEFRASVDTEASMTATWRDAWS